MRVLLVAPVPPPYGGMALQAGLLGRLLRKDGHTVALFPANPPLPRRLQILDRIPGVRTLTRTALIWLHLWTPVRQADVVHVFAASWVYFFTVVCASVVVGRVLGRRVVLNYRGGGAGAFIDRFGWFAGPILRMASAVTAPSEFLAGLIRGRFHIPVLIVPNIVDSCAFEYRKRKTIQPKMLVTRHLEEIYDVESVIRAFRLVQNEHPEASLWIAGTGRQEQYLRELVSQLNLRQVRFLGHVDHADLPGIYNQCDIYINASRVDNFPGALIEASAAGLVVVSTGAGGIPAIFENEVTALLVEPGDWSNLGLAVQRVLTIPGLAENMTTNALRLARMCDWTEVRRTLWKSYGWQAAGAAVETVGALEN
jgi:glycosyltransferase involved in cell wall biosynthesis